MIFWQKVCFNMMNMILNETVFSKNIVFCFHRKLIDIMNPPPNSQLKIVNLADQMKKTIAFTTENQKKSQKLHSLKICNSSFKGMCCLTHFILFPELHYIQVYQPICQSKADLGSL